MMINPGTPRIQSRSGIIGFASFCPERCRLADHSHGGRTTRRVSAGSRKRRARITGRVAGVI